MMLKQYSLAAALAATFITGSAAVAYADSDAGIHEAADCVDHQRSYGTRRP